LWLLDQAVEVTVKGGHLSSNGKANLRHQRRLADLSRLRSH